MRQYYLIHLILAAGLILPLYAFGAITYTIGFNSPINPPGGNVALPSSFGTITEANYQGTEQLGPYGVLAYSTKSDNPPVGMSITLENAGGVYGGHGVQIGNQLYMTNTAAPYPPPAPLTSEEVRIPYTVQFKPCKINGAPSNPVFTTLVPDIAQSYSFYYGSNYACLSTYSGTNGQFQVIRNVVPVMPFSGTYQGAFRFRISAE